MKKYALSLFFFLLFIFMFFASGVIDSQDGFTYLAVARDIYYKHAPVGPIDEYDPSPRLNIPLSTYVGKDGKTYASTGLGYSIAFLPAVFITDVVYHIYHITPPIHFPLQADWLILFLGSLTNSFFGAGLGVILYLYLLRLNLSHKQALIITFIGMFSTNLLVYAKDSLAHMMFTLFLFLTFFLVKVYSQNQRRLYLFIAGIMYGITIITYNQTFILSFPPLVLYYILLLKPKISKDSLKSVLIDGSLFIVGTIPFDYVYLWFENLRARPTSNLATAGFFMSYIQDFFGHTPLSLMYEGIWGQLFSPGRSILLYSPILLVIIFFWYKLDKSIKPEAIAFFSLAIIYILFYAGQYSPALPGQGIGPLWPGETSWGPRYLVPLIPFGLLLVGYIFIKLSRKIKLIVFVPLIVLGGYIELLGLLMPYQIKSNGMQSQFYVNNSDYNSSYYQDLLPRYSPIIIMTENLGALINDIPKSIDYGKYDIKFFDGIYFPAHINNQTFRTIEGNGYVSFNNLSDDPIKELSIEFENQTTTSPSLVQITLNGHKLTPQPLVLPVTSIRTIDFKLNKSYLKSQSNVLGITAYYPNSSTLDNSVAVFSFKLNNTLADLESLSYPYASPLGPAMSGSQYRTYTDSISDLWTMWDIHSQIYEKVLDFWWAKAFYYWDYPKKLFLFLFLVNLLGIGYFGLKVFRINLNINILKRFKK